MQNHLTRLPSNGQVKFHRSIRHPNLLIMLGAGIDDQDRAYLVTELMAGNLREYLDDDTKTLDMKMRLKLALDIAMGMKYLHGVGAAHLGKYR